MAGRSMEVRAPGGQQVEVSGKRFVVPRAGGGMFGVARLDPFESGRDQDGNQIVAPECSGMGKRGYAACIPDQIEDLAGREGILGYESRRVTTKPAPKRLVERADVAAIDERTRDVRARDRAFPAGRQDVSELDLQSQLDELGHDGPRPLDTPLREVRQRTPEMRIAGIDPIRQDMRLPIADMHGQLGAGQDIEPRRSSAARRFDSVDRIVVGDGEQSKTAGGRPASKLSRR